MNRDTEKAFGWIVGILNNHKISFQIEGGLAAKAHGAERELADIDLVIPEDNFVDILPEVKDFIKSGPLQLKDSHWDLLLITLEYEGQLIEIAGVYDQKYFDNVNKEWISAPSDFSKSELREIFGQIVPIVPKENLIRSKERLGRDVDIEDLKFLKG